MTRVFDPKLGHLPFDDARIAAIASRGKGLEDTSDNSCR